LSLGNTTKQGDGVVLDQLRRIGVSLVPGKVLLIYGPSMVGKSLLAWIIAREYVGDGVVVIYGSEPHYADQDYRSLAEKVLTGITHYINYTPYAQDVFKYTAKLYNLRQRIKDKKLVLILDSLSMIAQREAKKYYVKGITESRVIAARVVPLLNALATEIKDMAIQHRALGIIIAHAGSTAGSYRYRGIADLKPSMSMRTAHNVDYIVLMQREQDYAKITLVANRTKSELEGSTITLKLQLPSNK